MKIPKRLRKVINRSGSRPCDLCGTCELLHEHHINGRNIPNPNHPSNISNICPTCHNRVHNGKIIIEKWISTTAGKELLSHCPTKKSFSGEDSRAYIISPNNS